MTELTLPPQVQKQADDAAEYDRIINEANAAAANPGDVTAPTAPAPPAPPPPVAETPAPPQDDGTWKARYLTLQGMFNADVPRLNAQVKALQAEIESLKKAPPPAPPAPVSTITDKDTETFGGDLLDVIKRQAQAMIGPALEQAKATETKLLAEIESLKKVSGTVAERQATNDRATYFAQVEAQCPDFKEVNVNPEFLAWLEVVDSLSGIPRKAYIQNAFETMDAGRTAALFNAWKATKTTATPTPDIPRSEARRQLERQQSPAGSKENAPAPADTSAKIWRGAEVDQFYSDVRRGLYRGKEAEAARIEAEIDAAAASGRVTS